MRSNICDLIGSLYTEKKIDIDYIRSLVAEPDPMKLVYITKEEYKIITGEEY